MLNNFRNEYHIAGMLDDIDGVIQFYVLQKIDNGLMLVMEDIDAISLQQMIHQKQLPLSYALEIAIQVSTILGKIHEKSIIHKDMSTSNIIIHSETKCVKLIDFAFSEEFTAHKNTKRSDPLQGTLSYISPEQTGRMDRKVDFRSDYYSFGICLYEMITGRLPFVTKDPLRLIHCHIAKSPLTPHELNLDIPKPVSNIVMKLMAKNPEDRYQNMRAIHTDLTNCIQQLASSGEIKDFDIGKHDIPRHFSLSTKNYARERELKQMVNIFERMFARDHTNHSMNNHKTKPKTEVVLVKGDAGIGKTAFIDEVKKQVLRANLNNHIFFISGKYDRFSKNTPYSALVSAFSELIRQILKMDEKDLAVWRKKIQSSLNDNGQLLINVIPEIEWIIGGQPEMIKLTPKELQSRFQNTFQKFMMIFADTAHPLVIFLDNIQWIDPTSLKLLRLLLTNEDNTLLFIGAYRPGKMPEDHPLFETIAHIEQSNITVTMIPLRPLSKTHINQLICDTFRCLPVYAQSLTDVVMNKTHGNPFFINEFMTSVYEKKYIQLTDSGWKWNISQIEQTDITDNVVRLMSDKIQRLDDQTGLLIQSAACIGSEFSKDILTHIVSNEIMDIDRCINEAINEGMIVQTEQSKSEYGRCSLHAYRFVYDRVHQAAYALITDTKRQALHKKIGLFLLEKTNDDAKKAKVFDIVNHLNMGIGDCSDPKEKIQLSELNYKAGLRAKTSTAYEAAYMYFIIGISLMNDDQWESDYTLICSLYLEASESAFLIGKFDEMMRFSEAVLSHSTQLMDQAKAYEIRLQAFKMQDKKKEAIEIGQKVLAMLGVSIPDRANKLTAMIAIARIYFSMSGKRIEHLIDLPVMTQPEQQIITRILTFVATALYITSPEILPLVICEQIKLFNKYGNTPASSATYAAYGMILCGFLNDPDNGYRFGRLAISLLDKFQTREYWAKTLFRAGSFIFHWKEHVRDTLPMLNDACKNGIETGDIEFSVFARYVHGVYSILAGIELPIIKENVQTFMNNYPQLKHISAQHYRNLVQQLLENMMTSNKTPWILSGQFYQEETTFPYHIKSNDRTLIAIVYFTKGLLNYLFYRYEEALDCLDNAKIYLSGLMSTFVVPCVYFYDALIRLALYDHLSRFEQRKFFKIIVSNQKRLKNWSKHSPMNHLHRYHLVQAEICRIRKETSDAMIHYDKAIHLAKENQFLNDEALANELATRFYISNKKKKHAIPYLLDAYNAFHRYGAISKTDHLIQQYPFIKDVIRSINQTSSWNQLLSSNVSLQNAAKEIDLISIMRASTSISEEIVFSKLVEKLMLVVIENAGATRGCLILVQDDQLFVEAEIAEEKRENILIKSIPFVKRKDLPEQLINYVKRTHTDCVLIDASKTGDFTDDRYIHEQQIHSVMCIPILHHGELTGVLYLENNRMTGSFTANHVQILKLIASQAAISIENAKFYNQLEDKVQERTQELSQAIDALKQRAYELTILNKMSDMLNECRKEKDTHDVLQKTCEALFPDDCGFIAIQSMDSNSPEMIVHWNINEPITSAHLPECHCIKTNQKKTSTESIINNNCSPCHISEGTNVFCFPLMAQNQTIGVFHLQLNTKNDENKSDELQKIIQAREDLAVRMAEQYTLSLANLRLQKKLHMESIIDPLTKLFNRRYLEESLKRESNRCQRRKKNLGVIMIDIDHFKQFNDTYGHKMGDNVLSELGQFLKNVVRKEDIACRYGGEEFMLILPESNIHTAIERAEQICERIQQEVTVSHKEKKIAITASIGVAALEEHGPDITKVIARADEALYKAKGMGRNQVQVAE
jgi:diguanylate cyclase (GGDEF)-like protein